MKKIFLVIIAVSMISAIFLATQVQAKIAVPGRTTSWVNDYADIIETADKREIENMVNTFNQKDPKQPVEVIVGVFRSLDGWDFNEFAAIYGENWRKVKHWKRDNGIVIIFDCESGRLAIGIGQNLKNILTDEKVDHIINNLMMPDFKSGNYSRGMRNGVEMIINLLKDAKIPSGDPFLWVKIAFVLLIFIGSGLGIWKKLKT